MFSNINSFLEGMPEGISRKNPSILNKSVPLIEYLGKNNPPINIMAENNLSKFNLPKINLEKSKEWYMRSKEEFGKEKDSIYSGPTITSNWLIPDILLVGEYPIYNKKNTDKLKLLINLDIDTFVSLNPEYGKKNNHPVYENIIREIYKLNKPQSKKEIIFIQFPIEDMKIEGDIDKIIKLCSELYKKIYNGRRIYLHCTGGHGRTGTIAGILLCMLYKITPDQAFEYMQFAHDQRNANYPKYPKYPYNGKIDPNEENNGIKIKSLFQPGQIPTPQTSIQRNQVRSIVAKIVKDDIIKNINININIELKYPTLHYILDKIKDNEESVNLLYDILKIFGIRSDEGADERSESTGSNVSSVSTSEQVLNELIENKLKFIKEYISSSGEEQYKNLLQIFKAVYRIQFNRSNNQRYLEQKKKLLNVVKKLKNKKKITNNSFKNNNFKNIESFIKSKEKPENNSRNALSGNNSRNALSGNNLTNAKKNVLVASVAERYMMNNSLTPNEAILLYTGVLSKSQNNEGFLDFTMNEYYIYSRKLVGRKLETREELMEHCFLYYANGFFHINPNLAKKYAELESSLMKDSRILKGNKSDVNNKNLISVNNLFDSIYTLNKSKDFAQEFENNFIYNIKFNSSDFKSRFYNFCSQYNFLIDTICLCTKNNSNSNYKIKDSFTSTVSIGSSLLSLIGLRKSILPKTSKKIQNGGFLCPIRTDQNPAQQNPFCMLLICEIPLCLILLCLLIIICGTFALLGYILEKIGYGLIIVESKLYFYRNKKSNKKISNLMKTNLGRLQIIDLSLGDNKCFKITLNKDELPNVKIIKDNFNINIVNVEQILGGTTSEDNQRIAREKIIKYSIEIIQAFFKKISKGKTSVKKSVKTICSSLFFELDNMLNSIFINGTRENIITSPFTIKWSKYYPQMYFSSKQFIALKILLINMYGLNKTNKHKNKLSKLYAKYNSYHEIDLSKY